MRFKLLFALLILLSAFSSAQVTVHSFEGIDASTAKGNVKCCVIDPNGAVGTKQYLEWVDSAYQGYDKSTFAAVYSAPQAGDTPWVQAGQTNCEGTYGNGVVLFDHLASRWVIAVRQKTSAGSYYYCIAVSNTDDLTSSTFQWHAYSQLLDNVLGKNASGTVYFPDYPKIGTWRDGYYVTVDVQDPNNGYNQVGVLVCAFDRSNMLTGNPSPRPPQCFSYPSPYTSNFLGHSLLPADIEGTLAPPVGTPEAFVSIENPSTGSTTNALNYWQLHVNWSNPSSSTFTGPVASKVLPYTPGCYDAQLPVNTACVPEPSTATTGVFIDSVGDRLMHRFAYRKSSTSQSYLVSQAIQVGTTAGSQTGIRWYELNGKGSVIAFGTINRADRNYRFVPSVAQDKAGNLAVGYSVSGTGLSPSIRAAYVNLPTKTTPKEINLASGTADEENSYRWGGYTSMTIDPVDDCTFWYVNEYFTVAQISSLTWQTRISNFRIPGC